MASPTKEMVEHWRKNPVDFVRAIWDVPDSPMRPWRLSYLEAHLDVLKSKMIEFPSTDPLEIKSVGIEGSPVLGPTVSLVIIDDMIEPELTPEQEAMLQRYLKERFP